VDPVAEHHGLEGRARLPVRVRRAVEPTAHGLVAADERHDVPTAWVDDDERSLRAKLESVLAR
jgi:hypothetical protein